MTGWWFSPVSSTNKTDRHDITEILLKVALNIINQPKPAYVYKIFTAHVILVNIDLSIHSTIEIDIYMTALSPDLVQTLTCTIFMDPSPLNEMMWSCMFSTCE